MKSKQLRLEIHPLIPDTRADVQKLSWKSNLEIEVESIHIADVYTVDKAFSSTETLLVQQALAHPVTHTAFVHGSENIPQLDFDWAVEVGFLPGVTDNIGNTAKEILNDTLQTPFTEKEHVYSSRVYYIAGKLNKTQVQAITNSLYNPLIQRAHIKTRAEYTKDGGMDLIVPKVQLTQKMAVTHVDLHIPDDELAQLGKAGILNADGTRRGPLALDMLYLQTIRGYFDGKKRKPTDVELESIAQTWSEHCKHTIFADPIDEVEDGLYKTFIKAATAEIRKKKGDKDFCVSVFTDNSGAIEFDDTYLVTDKVETHNSPSALDPFGGAITGIVGVNRDALGFGLGAKPVINRYGFCFADPADTTPLYKGTKQTQPMLSPRRIMDGVIAGVNAGGNCSGIPTPQGFMYFDPRYKGKPLVFVGTVGLIPKKIKGKKVYTKKAKPGDYIVVVGGRVGLDGIHGATFSSEALDTGSPATAVQIGDPITQKKLSDALVKEALQLGLYSSITDNGAGGISCSVAEMARECGGCVVELEKVPLKYPGLSPWQIWISESQERMTLAVPKKNWKTLSNLMAMRGVEATVIGEFTKTPKCIVRYNTKTVMDVDMEFLHDGLPPRPMHTVMIEPQYPEPDFPQPKNLTAVLKKMLGRLNITSFEFISTQYDHEVQAGSVLKPLQGKGRVNADATVTRPVLDSPKGVVISQALFPKYSDIDSYAMAACAIDSAIRSAVAAGADPAAIALLDNFCWCSSTEPERLGQLKQAVQACYDYAVAFEAPFISGKDSMFNDFKGFDENDQPLKISIPPTLLISSISVLPDATKAVSLDLKVAGDLVYVLGETNDELGASEYFALQGEGKNPEQFVGNNVPQVLAAKNKKLYESFYKAVKKQLVASAITVGLGGLGTALAKTAVAGQLGLDVTLKKLAGHTSRDDFSLFSESQGRIVISLNPKNKQAFEKIMSGTSYTLIGKVTSVGIIRITNKKGEELIKLSVNDAQKAYKERFKNF